MPESKLEKKIRKLQTELIVSFRDFDAAMFRASKAFTWFGFAVGAAFNQMSRYRWPEKGRKA